MADYAYILSSTVTVVETAYVANHIYGEDTVTVSDTVRAERITYLVLPEDTVTAVETTEVKFRRVGNATWPAWRAEDYQEAFTRDLEAGETYSFILEDYFDYRTVCGSQLVLLNPEGLAVDAVVQEHVSGDVYDLFSGRLLPESATLLDVVQPLTLPQRTIYHTVSFTSQEATANVFVAVLFGGWAPRLTKLPVDLPCVPVGG